MAAVTARVRRPLEASSGQMDGCALSPDRTFGRALWSARNRLTNLGNNVVSVDDDPVDLAKLARFERGEADAFMVAVYE